MEGKHALIYSSFPLADRPVGRSVQIGNGSIHIHFAQAGHFDEKFQIFFDPMLFPNEILTFPEAP